MQKLAQAEGFPDALALAFGGEALACMELNRFTRARECFLRLHQVQKEMEDHEAAVISLHDAGVCLLKEGKSDDARNTMEDALAEARLHSVDEWIYRCRQDIALSHAEEGKLDQAIAALRDAASAEEQEGRAGVAAKLWESLATVLAKQAADGSPVEDAFLRAVAAFENEADSVEERVRLLSELYTFRWSSLAFDRALDTLREIERISKETRHRDGLCRAIDQRGMCLQELGRPAEAIAEHRKALRTARRLPETVVAEHCLNNLGEALRKTGRAAAAIPAFREAEALAHARGDHASALGTAHNRALALEDIGRRAQAQRLLQRCRDDARRLGFWHEYVRALHGLANHAWRMARPDDAVKQYRSALAEATKHYIPETAPIALNYANALRYQNRPRKAFAVMQATVQHFETLPDAHDYFAELGAAAVEAGNLKAAKDAYLRARDHALLVRDEAEAARASGALADIFEQDADYVEADKALREALTRDQPHEQRAALLKRRLGVLLKAGKNQQAGKVFARLRDLTETEGLKEEAVDAHMLVGDYEWQRGSKAKAVKAYTAALVPAAQLGLEVMLRTGMHTIRRLLSVDAESRLKEIELVEKALLTWLKRQPGPEEASAAVHSALWPLRVARRLALASAHGRAFSARRMANVLQEELSG